MNTNNIFNAKILNFFIEGSEGYRFDLISFLEFKRKKVINKSTEISVFFNQIILFLGFGLKAFRSYLNFSFASFDPHVGDNLCQVRALFFAQAFQENLYSIDELINLIKYFEKIRTIIFNCSKKKVNIPKRINEESFVGETYQVFLEKEGLIFHFNFKTFLLIASFFLTFFKSTKNNGIDSIFYEKICLEFGFSKTTAKKVVHFLQRFLSDFTVKLSIYHSSVYLNDFFSFKEIATFSSKDDIKRSIFPIYLATDSILRACYFSKVSIIFSVYNEEEIIKKPKYLLYFEPSLSKFSFEIKKNILLNEDKARLPCLVFKGISDYEAEFFLERFSLFGLVEIIMANMAEHPQYPGKCNGLNGKNIFCFVEENCKFPRKFFKYKEEFFRQKAVFSQINENQNFPKLFIIKHIFCDTLSNQIPDFQSAKQEYELEDVCYQVT